MSFVESPLISVIVPVYNVESYLDACLNSIKQQTYQNLEIIVVEDCSTDSSSIVLQPHLTDERVKLIQHAKNSGLSAARNTGIDAATGEYIMFVDSDDIIDLNLVQSCLLAAQESDADVVLLTVKPFQDGEPVQDVPELNSRINSYKLIAEADYFEYPHFAWLKFMRNELVRNKSLQFPVGQYYEDWPFHWETGFVASKIVLISDGYYHYRQRGDSITGSGDQKLLHIFTSHRLVASIAEQYSAPMQVKRIISRKIYNGIWFVLTTINSQYLNEALSKAKEQLELTREHRAHYSPPLKIHCLLFNLKLPFSLALFAITGMRAVLNQVSSARRKARR